MSARRPTLDPRSDRRLARLLAGGVLLARTDARARLAENADDDPLLIATAARYAERADPLADASLRGVPLTLVADCGAATDILRRSADGLGFGVGALEGNLFRDWAPRNLAAVDGPEWNRWRYFSETVFGFAGGGGRCPIVRAPDERTPRAFDVVRWRLAGRFLRAGHLPRTPGDFEALAGLASEIVFGADRSDLLEAVVVAAQAVPSLLGERAPGVPPALASEARAFALYAVSDAPQDTMASVAREVAVRQQGRAADAEGVADQLLGWYAMYDILLTTALPAALAILAVDAESRARLEAELDDPDFDPDVEGTFLNAVVLETLRLYNPSIALQRAATETVVLADGARIAAGEQLVVPFEACMRDARCYANPDAFEPERWLDPGSGSAAQEEREGGRCQGVFSTGTRTCPARRVALFVLRYALYLLLGRYSYRLAPDAQDVGIEDLRRMPDVIGPGAPSFVVTARSAGFARASALGA